MKRIFLKYTSASVVAQLISLVSILVCAKLYSPSAFGEFYFVIAISTAFVPLTTLRLDVDTALSSKSEQGNDYFVNTLILTLFITLIFMPIAYFGLSSILHFQEGTHEMMISLIFVTLLQSTIVFASGHAMRLNFVDVLGKSSILQNFATALLQISFAIKSPTPFMLLCGFILGRVFGLFYLILRIWSFISLITFELGRFLRFISAKRFVIWAGFCDSLILAFPFFISIHLSDFTTLGNLGLANLIVASPMNLLIGAITTTFLSNPNFAYDHESSKGRIEKKHVINQAKKMAVFAFFIIVLQTLFAAFLMQSLFGEKWQTSTEFVLLLSAPFAIQMCIAPMTIYIWREGQWKRYGNYSFLSFLVGIIAFFATHKFSTATFVSSLALYYVFRALTMALFVVLYIYREKD